MRSTTFVPRNRESPSTTLEPLEPRALLSYTFFGPDPSPPDPTRGELANAVFADFDGDGISDRAISDGNTISFAKGAADGSFGPDRTTTIGAPVGIITAGRFDGSGHSSLVAIGTRGGSVTLSRHNFGFRIRAIAFDPTAHADIGGTDPGAFVLVTQFDTPDYYLRGLLPRAYAGDFLAGWRDEFVLNLGQAGNQTDLAVFSFINRSTIALTAHVYASDQPLGDIAVADTLGAGKSQIVIAQTLGASSVIKYIAPATNGQWHTSTVRIFPASFFSLAAADMDGDHRADIVALPISTPSPGDFPHGSARLWLLHSQGDGSFAAPCAISPRLLVDDWSSPANTYQAGLPSIADIGDLNGDGRPDVLIIATSIFYYRINSYTVNLTAALQRPDGRTDIVPTPFAADASMGSENLSVFSGIRFVNAPDPLGRPSLLASGIYLLHPFTDQQASQVMGFTAFVYGSTFGQPSLGLPTHFTAKAFDVDALRGGSVASMNFYVDLNNNGLADPTDILIASIATPDADGYYRFTANVDASWGPPGTLAHFLAVAVDDTGLRSDPARYGIDL